MVIDYSQNIDADKDKLQNSISFCNDWTKPKFPIDGHDALEAGYSGEGIRVVLKLLEHQWVESDFKLTREELLTNM